MSLLLVICTALGWGIIHQGDIRPGVIGILVDILISVLSIWAFLRYDFLTSFLALFTFTVWYHGAALFFLQNESALQSGYGLITFMSFFVVVGLIAIATKDQVSDFDAITPAFVWHITERQRLQGELAVARMADNSSDSARQHLERIFTEVKKFMGKAQQQDDMTMVIVKIT